MQKYIVLLRGINVGGHRKVPMADLRQLLSVNGFVDVKTYIQSGNVVLKSKLKTAQEVEQNVAELIHSHFGFEVGVYAFFEENWQSIIDGNPFVKTEPDIGKLYVAFLKTTPSAEGINKLKDVDFGADEYKIVGDKIYLKYATKASQSKLTNPTIERKLGVEATSRNWRTTLKMGEM